MVVVRRVTALICAVRPAALRKVGLVGALVTWAVPSAAGSAVNAPAGERADFGL